MSRMTFKNVPTRQSSKRQTHSGSKECHGLYLGSYAIINVRMRALRGVGFECLTVFSRVPPCHLHARHTLLVRHLHCCSKQRQPEKRQSAPYRDVPTYRDSTLCLLTAAHYVVSCSIGLDGRTMLPQSERAFSFFRDETCIGMRQGRLQQIGQSGRRMCGKTVMGDG